MRLAYSINLNTQIFKVILYWMWSYVFCTLHETYGLVPISLSATSMDGCGCVYNKKKIYDSVALLGQPMYRSMLLNLSN